MPFHVIAGGSNMEHGTKSSIIEINSCVKLFENLWLNESKDKNFAFSPFSMFAVLGILASGSSGKTLKHILEFLNYENLDDLNRVSARIIEELIQGKTSVNEEGPKLCFVSGIWATNRYALNPVFKETVMATYKAEVESVDFQQSEVVRSNVNKWVERNTNGLIKGILIKGSINSKTVVLAANALYFKGSWQPDQFDPELTNEGTFYLLSGTRIKVPFMFTEEEYLCVSCYDDFKVLKLPYRTLEVAAEKKEKRRKIDKSSTQCFSMYIILPDARDGLGELIEKASSDSAGFLGSYLPTDKVAVDKFKLPKFKISFDFKATRVLNELGLKLPFDAGKADFAEMLMMGIDESIPISEVIHKCFVEVDEEGTEASAYTEETIGDSFCSGDTPPHPRGIDFVADHPFMFIVREEKSGAVLFAGHVLDPLLES